MTKHEFLEKLKKEGYNNKVINDYELLINKRLEAGDAEGDIIIDLVLKENQKLKKSGKNKSVSKHKDASTRNKLIILAICLWPITLPLAIAAVTIVVTLVAVALSFLIAAPASVLWGLAAIVELIIYGASFQYLVFYLGYTFILTGVLGLLGWYGWKLMKRFYDWITPYFQKKQIDSKESKHENA